MSDVREACVCVRGAQARRSKKKVEVNKDVSLKLPEPSGETMDWCTFWADKLQAPRHLHCGGGCCCYDHYCYYRYYFHDCYHDCY